MLGCLSNETRLCRKPTHHERFARTRRPLNYLEYDQRQSAKNFQRLACYCRGKVNANLRQHWHASNAFWELAPSGRSAQMKNTERPHVTQRWTNVLYLVRPDQWFKRAVKTKVGKEKHLHNDTNMASTVSKHCQCPNLHIDRFVLIGIFPHMHVLHVLVSIHDGYSVKTLCISKLILYNVFLGGQYLKCLEALK